MPGIIKMRCLLALTIIFSSAVYSDNQKLQILVSIRPLALITQDLVGDLAEVDTLLPPAASPHNYTLRVSDLKRLQAADLVVWLGPEMEKFLEKPLAQLNQSQVLALNPAELESDKGHDHEHSDPHGWLDPEIAIDYAEAIAREISSSTPSLNQLVSERLQSLKSNYGGVVDLAEKELSEVKSKGFVVYHRGLDPFVERFGLRQLGWVSLNPEQPPGARHLTELRNTLEREHAQCLFTDGAHSTARAEAIAKQFELRFQVLDTTASRPAVTSYRELIMALAKAVRSCLQGDSPSP